MDRIDNIIAKLLAKQAVADEYTTSELIEIYNRGVTQLDRPGDVIKSFHDKKKAVARVNGIIVELNADSKVAKEKAKPTTTVQEDVKTVMTSAPAAAAATPKAAKSKANGSGKLTKEKDDTVITILATANPHRKDTINHGKFAKLEDGMTIGAAVAKGVQRGYFQYWKRLGHIKF